VGIYHSRAYLSILSRKVSVKKAYEMIDFDYFLNTQVQLKIYYKRKDWKFDLYVKFFENLKIDLLIA
jgi:hypothetical protein